MFAQDESGDARADAPQRSHSRKASKSGGGDEDARTSAQKNRQRASMACVHCRRRKIRCDGQARPCATCARLGKVCDYEPITEEENLIAREKKRASKSKKAEFADESEANEDGTGPLLIPSRLASTSSQQQPPSSPAYSETSTSFSRSLDGPAEGVTPGPLRLRKASSVSSSGIKGRKRHDAASKSVGLGLDRSSSLRSSAQGRTAAVSWTNPFPSSPSSCKTSGAVSVPQHHKAPFGTEAASPTSTASQSHLDEGSSTWVPPTVLTQNMFLSSRDTSRSEDSNASDVKVNDASERAIAHWSEGLALNQADVASGDALMSGPDMHAFGSHNPFGFGEPSFTSFPEASTNALASHSELSFLTQGFDDSTLNVNSPPRSVSDWLQDPSVSFENKKAHLPHLDLGESWEFSTNPYDLSGSSSMLTGGGYRSNIGIGSERGSTSSFQSGVRSQLSSFSSSLPTNTSTAASIRSSPAMSPPNAFGKEASSLSPSGLSNSRVRGSSPPMSMSALWPSAFGMQTGDSGGGSFASREAMFLSSQRPQGVSSQSFGSGNGDSGNFNGGQTLQDIFENVASVDFTTLNTNGALYSPTDTTNLPSLSPMSSPRTNTKSDTSRQLGASMGQMLTASQQHQRQQRRQQEQASAAQGQGKEQASDVLWNDAFWAVPTTPSRPAMTTQGAAAAAALSPNDILSLKSSADPSQAHKAPFAPRALPFLSREEAIQTPPFLQLSQRRED